MPTGQYWWGDLGDGVNIPVAAGLKMTHSLSAGSGLPADLRTMPLEQALLHLSSLRYHLRASDWDIDELAGQLDAAGATQMPIYITEIGWPNFNGRFGGVWIYDRALTGAERSNFFNAGFN